MPSTPQEEANRQLFLKALQKDPIQCPRAGCGGSVLAQDLSTVNDRVKTFEFRCERCNGKDQITGQEASVQTWDDTAVLDIAYAHLMHQPAVCPHDGITVVFTSLPNPRRKARYRLSCYYCGRQAEMDWPPQEFRR
jgi:hypothetical protein